MADSDGKLLDCGDLYWHKYFQLPSRDDLRNIDIVLCVMLGLYSLVFVFTIFNSVKYLIKQNRYHNCMITVFYIFSMIVITFRMLFYIALLFFND